MRKNRSDTVWREERESMKRSKLTFWLFLAPCLLCFLGFVLIPTIMGFYYSLTDWNGVAKAPEFIGFANYVSVFKDGQYWYSFAYTALFTLCSVLLINGVGFLLALLVTKKFKGSTFMRGVFFMPNLVGGLLLGYTWKFIFTKIFPATNIPILGNWLADNKTGFLGLLILMVWQMSGYMMIIYIAGIQNIPDSVMEAAALDGATGMKRMFKITIPMVAQSFTIGLFLVLSNSFKLFDQNLSLTGGNPNHKNEMLALNIYNTAFNSNEMGEAQAKAAIFFLSVAIISVIQLTVTKKAEVEA